MPFYRTPASYSGKNTLVPDPEFALSPIVRAARSTNLSEFSTLAMQTFARHVEGAILGNRDGGRLFVGFRNLSRFLPYLSRYRELAQVSDEVVVFAVPDADAPHIPGVTIVRLSPQHALARESFIVVNTSGFVSAMVAEELPGASPDGGDERLRGLLTFDHDLVSQLHRALRHQVAFFTDELHPYPRYRHGETLEAAETIINRTVAHLEQRRRKLVEAELFQREMIDVLVHDMRGPLSSMRLRLDMLARRGTLDEGQQQALAAASESTTRLSHMMENALALSRMIDRGLTLDRKPCKLDELMHKALETVQPSAECRHVALQYAPAGHLPTVEVDEDYVVHALVNILHVVLRNTPQEQRVSIVAGRDGGSVLVVVGNGELTRYRGAEAWSPPHCEGSEGAPQRVRDLALDYSSLVAEAHGGRMWVDGAEQNMVIYLSLPLA